MKKILLAIILSLSCIIYAGYYLYRYDKRPTQADSIATLEQPNQKSAVSKSSPPPPLPPYLTDIFWKTVTPQELEIQIKSIANVNEVRPRDKKSMLHLLTIHGSYPEMIKMLIDAGVDYKLRDKVKKTYKPNEIDNRTALFYAIIRDSLSFEFTKALLEYYTDINIYINSSITALILATYNRQSIDFIKMLLEKGADPNLKSKTSDANSLIAASSPNRIIKNFYINPEVIQLLLDYKGDITATNKIGKNAFDYMKENQEFRQTELFKKLSAQLSQKK